ncbi:MAG: beta strand repeat-containing protein, partial [Bradyrhizobium sp.]
GGGTVNFTTGNNYTGTTTIRNGTINVATINSVVGGTATSSLGAPTTALNGTIALGSGSNSVALNYTGTGETTDRVINFAGSGGTATISNSGTGALIFSSAPTFAAGSKTVTLGAATDSIGGTIGVIANGSSGTVTLVKNGLTNSTWILTGTNTHTGSTTISGGVLQVNAVSDLSTSYISLAGSLNKLAVLQTQGTLTRTLSGTASSANINVSSFGGFAAKGGSLTVTLSANAGLTWGSGNFMGNGTDPLVFGSTTSDNLVQLTNPINLNTADAFLRVITVNGNAATVAGGVGTTDYGLSGSRALLSGVISGGVAAASATGITKNGNGTLVLSGVNTYQNQTLVSAGTLVAGGNVPAGGVAGAFGTGAGATATPGTTFYTINLGDANTTANNASPTVLIGGNYTIARPISINNNATTGTYGIGGSTDNASTISGAITAAQSFRVTQVATTSTNALNITGGIAGAATAAIKTVNFANVGAVNVSTAAISDGAGGGKIALSQTGAGTTTLSFANTFTGTTTVSAGTLVANASTGQALGATTGVTISGGTLLLGQNEQINNVAPMTLSGGTFATGGLSETLGTLTLSGSSVINLGGLASIIHFADSSALAWSGTLSIYNWNGLQTGGGTDQVYFGNTASGLAGLQLGNINIYSDGGGTLLGTGALLSNGELVFAAIPEPQTYAFFVSGLLLSLIVVRRLRQQRNA